MLDQTKTQEENQNAFEPLPPAPKKRMVYFGKFDYSEWLCGFTAAVKDENGNVIQKGSKDPFDPQIHKSSSLAIDLYIQLLPEIQPPNAKLLEYRVTRGSLQWEKETLPSLISLGVKAKEQINNAWGAIEIIESRKTYNDKNGELRHNLSWVFLALYPDQETCRAGYLQYLTEIGEDAPSNDNRHNAPQVVALSNEDSESATAYAFLKVIVSNAARGKATFAEAQEAVGLALAQYPTVSRFYLANSVETGELITEVTKLLPF